MEELIIAIMDYLDIKNLNMLVDAVLKRLAGLGYTPAEDDAWMIAFDIQKVVNFIKNTCNTTSVPDGLFYVAVDRVCGEVLDTLKQTGKLVMDDLDLDGAITQIKEGDTTVNFADGSSDVQKLDALLTALKNEGAGELVCYRKIKW